MKGHEWREGMENEANSVEDAAWARETRLAANAPGTRQWLVISLICTVSSVAFAMIVMLLTTQYPEFFIIQGDRPPAIPAGQLLTGLTPPISIFLLSFLMIRKNHSVLAIIGLHLTNFTLFSLMSNFATIPYEYTYLQPGRTDISITQITDLLPSISISSRDILSFLAWIAVPTLLGITTARLTTKRTRRLA